MKTLNARDIPEDRLATTDESGKRVYIHPADTQGRFKKIRMWVHAFMILFFLFLPWVRFHGQPLILLDIAHRRFTLFGTTFWAHEAPILVFIFIGGVITIAFITSVWGRFWCGWACPQTVFIESVFRRIERMIEGDAVARRKLDQSPWDANKITLKFFKWLLFLAVGLIIAHSFLAYFVGTETLMQMMKSSPTQNPTPFLVMAFTTALLLFDFGWFREQFCIIACPYGRFQSVFLDDRSLVIGYDVIRGEPRHQKTVMSEKQGDCVNCFRCVDVCPTGIDIRRGVQLECIACTACIDACDSVMQRLEKPKGLIRYDSLANLEHRSPQSFKGRKWIYLIFIFLIAMGLTITLSKRQILDVAFVRAKEEPYREIKKDGNNITLLNHYKVHLNNQGAEPLSIEIEAISQNEIKLVTPIHPLIIPSGKSATADLFIEFPKSLLVFGKKQIQIRFTAPAGNHQKPLDRQEALTLVGPIQ